LKVLSAYEKPASNCHDVADVTLTHIKYLVVAQFRVCFAYLKVFSFSQTVDNCSHVHSFPAVVVVLVINISVLEKRRELG
jgi:hypothetical protein